MPSNPYARAVGLIDNPWQGELPPLLHDVALRLHEDCRYFLNGEALGFLEYLVRVQVLGICMVNAEVIPGPSPSSEPMAVDLVIGLRVSDVWPDPWRRFYQTEERAAVIYRRLADRAGMNIYRIVENAAEEDYEYPTTARMRSSPSVVQRRPVVTLTIMRPRPPAKPRDSYWLAKRLAQEWKGAGFDGTWATRASAGFKKWYKTNVPKGMYIPTPRDLQAAPLRRRITVRRAVRGR